MSISISFSNQETFSLEGSPSRFNFFSSFSPSTHKRRVGTQENRRSAVLSPRIQVPLPLSIHRTQSDSRSSPYTEAGLEVQDIFLHSPEYSETLSCSREMDRPCMRATNVLPNQTDFDSLLDSWEWQQLENRSVTPFVY